MSMNDGMNDGLVEVQDGLRVRFPRRDPSFIEGVEIGLALAEMAHGPAEIVRTLRSGSVEQAEELARHFGYRCQTMSQDRRSTTLRFLGRQARPKLRLVAP